jgi:uncharacterized protein
MYADQLLRAWLDRLLEHVPGAVIFDAHTHMGGNDPSGFSASVEELLDALKLADARAAVFPMAEPGGYRAANLACAEAATANSDRLVAFARVTPQENPTELLEAALEAGARGVKLHLSSDEFDLCDARLDGVFEIADERRLPVMVHGGPELNGLGQAPRQVCSRWPGLRLTLAHCALTDLGLLRHQLDDLPNLFFDTSWWTPANVLAVMKLIPPARILNASDLPYCTPLSSTIKNIRCAWQAGYSPDQIRSVTGGQFARLVEGQEPLELGPPPVGEGHPPGPLQEVVCTNLLSSLEALQRGDDPGVPLTVARHACTVRSDDPEAPLLASVLELLDLYEDQHDQLPQQNQYRPGWDLVSAAAFVARTPAAPSA